MIESDEDSDIKKLVFCYSELLQEVAFRDEGERGIGRGKIEGSDELINARIQQSIGWSKNRMNVRFVMALQID